MERRLQFLIISNAPITASDQNRMIAFASSAPICAVARAGSDAVTGRDATFAPSKAKVRKWRIVAYQRFWSSAPNQGFLSTCERHTAYDGEPFARLFWNCPNALILFAGVPTPRSNCCACIPISYRAACRLKLRTASSYSEAASSEAF